MSRILTILSLLFLFIGCSSIHYNTLYQKEDALHIERLSKMLQKISHDPKESKELATLAITYSKALANRYKLVSPPLYHNFLVNSGQRKKGLCYDFVDDLMAEIRTRHFKHFRFRWGRANANQLNEHNVIVVLSQNTPFQEGIILDAWRNSGILYFTKVKNDLKYRFQPWAEGDLRINP